MIVKSLNASYNGTYMVTPELLEFIREQNDAGMSREELEQLLLAEGGWTRSDVDEAFASLFQAKRQLDAVPAVAVTPPPIEEPKPVVVRHVDVPAEEPVIETIPHEVASAITLPSTVAPVEVAVASDVAAQPVRHEVVFEPSPLVLPPQETPTPPVASAESAHFVVPETPPAPAPLTPPVFVLEHVVPRVEERPIVTASLAEDFLGIFSSFRASSWANKPTAMKSTDAVRPLTPSRKVENSFSKSQTSTFENALSGNTAKKAGNADSPTPLQDISSGHSSFSQSFATQVTQEPVTAFKFDFAKMRNTPSDQVATEKAAELAARHEANGVSLGENGGVSVEALQFIGSQERPAEVPQHEKSTLTGHRTMAGDLLLRGLAPVAPPIPVAIHTEAVVPIPPPPVPPDTESLPVMDRLTSAPVPTIAEDQISKNATKRILGLAVGGVAVLALIGGGAFMFMKLGAPNADVMIVGAFTKLFGASSLAYKGQGSVDLMLSTATGGVARTGTIKFDLNYDGSLNSSSDGFGDGLHRLKLTGGLQSGDFSWPAYLETNIRLIGSTLYFHLLSLPPDSKLDAEVMNKYWIKIDLSEIAKELALTGVVTAGEGYGNFGGQNKDSTFASLVKKHAPFQADGKLPDETIGGVPTYHIKLKSNSEPMLLFTSELYRKYIGTDLVLTDDKRIRLKDALAKMVGEIWVSKNSGELVQLRVSGDFDDDMFDVHVKGKMNLLFTLSGFNKVVKVDLPIPTLTLEELKAQIEQFQKLKEVRARDAQKIEVMNGLVRSLDSYNSAKGRFPTTLSELYGAGILATSSVPEQTLKLYEYESYVSGVPLVKANRCTQKGKTCPFYHLGVSLEDTENLIFAGDADVTGDVRGVDAAGCLGEKNFACYDVIPRLNKTPPTSATLTQ